MEVLVHTITIHIHVVVTNGNQIYFCMQFWTNFLGSQDCISVKVLARKLKRDF